MARKDEVKIVHPRTAMRAIEGFHGDANYLLTMTRNAHSFLIDDSLDAEKVRKAIAPQLKEAIDRMAKWYDAD